MPKSPKELRKMDPTCAKCANTCKYYSEDGKIVICPNFKKLNGEKK
jgi:hypothetical protein